MRALYLEDFAGAKSVLAHYPEFIGRVEYLTSPPFPLYEIQNTYGVALLQLSRQQSTEGESARSDMLNSACVVLTQAVDNISRDVEHVPIFSGVCGNNLARALYFQGVGLKDDARLDEAFKMADKALATVQRYGATRIRVELESTCGDCLREIGRLRKDAKLVCQAVARHDAADKVFKQFKKEHDALEVFPGDDPFESDFRLLGELDIDLLKECAGKHGFDFDLINKDLKLSK
jgi:hypothetical protein